MIQCSFCGGIVGEDCLNPAELQKLETCTETAHARLWEIVHTELEGDVYDEANELLDVLATAALVTRLASNTDSEPRSG